jgi:hypothetical protein
MSTREEEIKARLDTVKAYGKEWPVRAHSFSDYQFGNCTDYYVAGGKFQSKPMAEFVSHARDDIPYLLAEVNRLRVLLEIVG